MVEEAVDIVPVQKIAWQNCKTSESTFDDRPPGSATQTTSTVVPVSIAQSPAVLAWESKGSDDVADKETSLKERVSSDDYSCMPYESMDGNLAMGATTVTTLVLSSEGEEEESTEEWDALSRFSLRFDNLARREGRFLAHVAVVLALLFRDAIFWAERDGDTLLGFIVLGLYALLVSFLLALALPYGQHGKPPWLVVGALQIVVAFTSAHWRFVVTGHTDYEHDYAVWMACLLQLVVLALYQIDRVAMVLTFCLCLLTCFCFTSTSSSSGHVWSDALLLCSVGVACVVGSPRSIHDAKDVQPIIVQAVLGNRRGHSSEERAEILRELFDYVSEVHVDGDPNMFGTRLDHVIKRLRFAMAKVGKTTFIEPALRDAIVEVLGELVVELSGSGGVAPEDAMLTRMTESATQMTVQYLQSELAQNNNLRLNTLLERHQPSTKTWDSEPVGTSGTSPFGRGASTGSKKSRATESFNGASLHETTVVAMLTEMTKSLQYVDDTYHPSPRPDAITLSEISPDLGKWDFNVLNIPHSCQHRPLASVGQLLLRPFKKEFSIQDDRLEAFLTNVESRYNHNNLYHNAQHGADVMNSLQYICSRSHPAVKELTTMEKFTALISAAAHDVGHDGRANRYHVTIGSALARLYNDQSVLENMHCAIFFAVLHAENCNLLSELDEASEVLFRSLALNMILSTDMAKHIQIVSRFRHMFLGLEESSGADRRKSFVKPVAAEEDPPTSEPQRKKSLRAGSFPTTTVKKDSAPLDLNQRRELLNFMLKSADLGHSGKQFNTHVQWMLRICGEMFEQGDAERNLGLPCSPFCDRETCHLAESQGGFFDFIATPLHSALAEYIKGRFQVEVVGELERNRTFWKNFVNADLSYMNANPMAHAADLQNLFSPSSESRRGSMPDQSDVVEFMDKVYSRSSKRQNTGGKKLKSGSMEDVSTVQASNSQTIVSSKGYCNIASCASA